MKLTSFQFAVAVLIADPQVAAGEWKIEIQTPQKSTSHIWPEHSGEPMTVECDAMPIEEK